MLLIDGVLLEQWLHIGGRPILASGPVGLLGLHLQDLVGQYSQAYTSEQLVWLMVFLFDLQNKYVILTNPYERVWVGGQCPARCWVSTMYSAARARRWEEPLIPPTWRSKFASACLHTVGPVRGTGISPSACHLPITYSLNQTFRAQDWALFSVKHVWIGASDHILTLHACCFIDLLCTCSSTATCHLYKHAILFISTSDFDAYVFLVSQVLTAREVLWLEYDASFNC